MFDLAFRSGHDLSVMMFAAGLMFASFAIAYSSAIAFPPINGNSRIAAIIGKVCLVMLVASAIWFVSAAYDYMKVIDMFKPPKT